MSYPNATILRHQLSFVGHNTITVVVTYEREHRKMPWRIEVVCGAQVHTTVLTLHNLPI
jgi:hypothetical protein